MRLTKKYEDGTYGVADDLPCGENSHAFKKLVIDKLGALEDSEAELTKEREAGTLRKAIQVWLLAKIDESDLRDSSDPWERGCRSAFRDIWTELDVGTLSRKTIQEGNEPNEG